MAENTKIYVVDTSYVLAFLLPDEKNDEVDEVFAKFKKGEVMLISSFLLSYEVLNSLRSAVIGKRITTEQAFLLIHSFEKLRIELMWADSSEILEYSLKYNITAYDSSYVTLSEEEKVNLLTFDKKLKKIVKFH